MHERASKGSSGVTAMQIIDKMKKDPPNGSLQRVASGPGDPQLVRWTLARRRPAVNPHVAAGAVTLWVPSMALVRSREASNKPPADTDVLDANIRGQSDPWPRAAFPRRPLVALLIKR